MIPKKSIIALVVLAGIGTALWLAHRNPNPLPASAKADRVLVEKSRRRLTLFRNDTPLKSYRIALGGSPVGQKQHEGDKRTPEGQYSINGRNQRSVYHLALHVSYPSPQQEDIARKREGSPGGNVEIHGLYNGLGWLGALHRLRDWTAGCIAVTNTEVEEIARAVPNGTRIEIVP